MMSYNGPIDLDAMVDLDSLAVVGVGHWTFFAFPLSTLNEYRVPSDPEAQQYIADVQSMGVPIGIWLNSVVDGTGYAAVTRENISQLNEAIEGLTKYSDSYAVDLCERLFRDAASGTR